MSCPAQNASPAPVSTSTSVAESLASSSSASSISMWSCGLMALRLSGRFMISQVMPSCFSIRTVSYFFVVTVFLLRLLERGATPHSGARQGARGEAARQHVKDRGDHRHQHGPDQPQGGK